METTFWHLNCLVTSMFLITTCHLTFWWTFMFDSWQKGLPLTAILPSKPTHYCIAEDVKETNWISWPYAQLLVLLVKFFVWKCSHHSGCHACHNISPLPFNLFCYQKGVPVFYIIMPVLIKIFYNGRYLFYLTVIHFGWTWNIEYWYNMSMA